MACGGPPERYGTPLSRGEDASLSREERGALSHHTQPRDRLARLLRWAGTGYLCVCLNGLSRCPTDGGYRDRQCLNLVYSPAVVFGLNWQLV